MTVTAVGKLKEDFWRQACAEYLKRLSGYARIEVKEVADVDPSRAGGVSSARAREADAVLATLGDAQHVILLAAEGTQRTSEQIASRLDALFLGGTSDIAFVIGGSHGVDASVYDRADETLSLGRITLPHNLARVVLLEQIYRSFKISRGEPYHK